VSVEQGLVQVYTGDGKGKTTAAIGLAVRALGHGRRVLLVRLLKAAEAECGEVALLQGQPGLRILTAGQGIIGRSYRAEDVAENVGKTFDQASALLAEYPFDLVIFDEINNALHKGFLDLARLLAFLERRPAGLEVVLTGRHAPAELLARADLVTRMEKVRHPYDAGVPARRGIEF
jgi:cob(I)alamin adenosyltransferase